jgi:CheY-like chemotaxis protein
MEPIILLVEDDEADALFFKWALEKSHFAFQLHLARHGEEAIEYLNGTGKFSNRDSFPLPHIIITDTKMPVLDGVAFLRWRKARPEFSAIPVIVLGGLSSPREIEAMSALGVCSHFEKPSNALEQQVVVGKVFEILGLGDSQK